MKRSIALILVMLTFTVFSACANGKQEIPVSSSVEKGKSLVVYFSLPETDNSSNMTTEEANSTVVINGEVLGNTQYVAYLIQEMTGGDIFRIIPSVDYPLPHDVLIEYALNEQRSDARPEIRDVIEDFDSYDTFFIGYPNWWGDMPMIMYTFFDTYDFSGKTIIPFNTHGGSRFSNTINTIADMEEDAEVIRDGLTISRNNVQSVAEREVENWLKNLGYID